jgi:hypothetical protein
MLENVYEKYPEVRERKREGIGAIPSQHYIKVDEDTTERYAHRAFSLIKDALRERSEGRAPKRDSLTALQYAILYDRHNERDPQDPRRKKWTYEKLAEKFELSSGRAEKAHVEEGRELLSNKLQPKE